MCVCVCECACVSVCVCVRDIENESLWERESARERARKRCDVPEAEVGRAHGKIAPNVLHGAFTQATAETTK